MRQLCGSVIVVWGCACGTVIGTEKTDAETAADELVREALERETLGLDKERTQLLEDAARAAPDYAPVHWHRGRVQHRGKWVPAEDVPQLQKKNRLQASYEARRNRAPDTVPGQLALAEWCRRKKLADRERAHLSRVVDLNPDHAAARQRLGFRRVGEQWLLASEIQAANDRARRERKNLTKWLPEMQRIGKAFSHRSLHRRRVAQERFRNIDSADAIPAMEASLSLHSLPVAESPPRF